MAAKSKQPNEQAAGEAQAAPSHRLKPSRLIDTRVIYCGDNLEQLKKLPDACVGLIYIDPPFNSNYEVFWARPRRSPTSMTAMPAPQPTFI
jgi:16S rRNA G966 N2-methylase RsmD